MSRARARSKTSVIRCWKPHCRTALPIKKPLPRGWASGSTIPAARRLKRCTRSFVNCRRGYEGKVRDYRTNARAYWPIAHRRRGGSLYRRRGADDDHDRPNPRAAEARLETSRVGPEDDGQGAPDRDDRGAPSSKQSIKL